jgi:hypothetical protein
MIVHTNKTGDGGGSEATRNPFVDQVADNINSYWRRTARRNASFYTSIVDCFLPLLKSLNPSREPSNVWRKSIL